jgi:hypothetical protein
MGCTEVGAGWGGEADCKVPSCLVGSSLLGAAVLVAAVPRAGNHPSASWVIKVIVVSTKPTTTAALPYFQLI